MPIAPGDRSHVKKRAVKRKPQTSAPPRNADTGDPARSRPAPKRKKAVKKKPYVLDRRTPDQTDRKRLHPTTPRKPTPVSPDRRDERERSPEQKQRDKAASAKAVKESRRKFLRRERRGSGIDAIKKFLEGGFAVNEASGVSTGTGPTTRVLRKKRGGGLQFAQVSTGVPRGVKVDRDTIAGRFAMDLANLPAQVVPSVYVPVAGVVEAAQGDPERLKQLLKDIDESDPVYNVVAAAYEAITGDEKAAKERLDRAKKAADEHPGYAFAEVVGAKGTVGRGTGAAMRHSPNEKLRKAASTERESRTLPGTSLTEKRAYSPDVITKAAQVVAERINRERAQAHRETARKVEVENPAEAQRLREKAAQIDPNRPISEREVQRRVDEHVDAREIVRRQHRDVATTEARRDVRESGADKAGPLANLIIQGIVRGDVDDARAYVAELGAEFTRLDSAGKRANLELRRGIEDALKAVDKGKVNVGALRDLAARYREAQAAREQALAKREILPTSQADMAAAIPYAVRRMDARHDPELGLVDPDGNPLSLAAIREHMEAAGEPIPSWLSQAPNSRGARNFFVSSGRPPYVRNESRTGEATRAGLFDADPETLVEQAARQQGLIDAFDGFHAFLGEFAVKGGAGKIKTLQTRKQAEQAARNAIVDEHGAPIPGAVKAVPVRVNPFGGRAEQLQRMLEDHEPANVELASATIKEALDRALSGEDVGAGPWALVPEVAARRLQGHMNLLSPDNFTRVFQKANTQFRRTVLGTSLPWITGNVAEGGMRVGLAKAGPLSWLAGHRVLDRAKEIDRDRGEMLEARTVSGAHFSSVGRNEVHFNVDALDPGHVKTLSRALGAVWRAPGPKQAAALWNGYTRVVFDLVNRTLERELQTAALGKALREQKLLDSSLLRLSDAAVDKAAHGALDTATAVALGRRVDDVIGKYGKFGPGQRRVIAMYTPFVAWTINAARFILVSLPRDHPTALAVSAALVNATEEWRKEHGLDKFIEGAVPTWLQGSIPGPGGTHFRAPNRYTPFSLGSDPVGTLTGAVLPQLSGIMAAGKGEEWNGKKLEDDSDAGKAKAAVGSFLSSTIPFLALGQRIAEKGPKSAILDAAIGRVEPHKRRRAVRRKSSTKPGRIDLGSGVDLGLSGGGEIVGPGVGPGGGEIVIR